MPHWNLASEVQQSVLTNFKAVREILLQEVRLNLDLLYGATDTTCGIQGKAKHQPVKLAREKMVLFVTEELNTSTQRHVWQVLTFRKSHASLRLPFRTIRRFDRKCLKWGTHDGNGRSFDDYKR